jgi:excisionase family DNA binding protein
MPERPDAAGDHRAPDRLITPKDAADRLAVSPSTVLLWLKTGQLKGVKAGKLWRIRERAIDEFLKEPEPVREPSRADGFVWQEGDIEIHEPGEEPAGASEETKELNVDDVINWERYDALKAQGLSRRAIAREMRIAETTLRRLEKRR